jgi:hypothetical protein
MDHVAVKLALTKPGYDLPVVGETFREGTE